MLPEPPNPLAGLELSDAQLRRVAALLGLANREPVARPEVSGTTVPGEDEAA
ncbi:hypothetical protein [Streptomyces sp. SP17KL33]|uniref:hypothetical protein n=1 Tax=Streptomyces sp. SP17KL33 TaxID=3002534 RepID=UPI002E75CDA0|nr:hypothetical protein [Streptomyces sp. SP17KL33]MEE1834909.1 hypothetical protein [Streptomyces sp. SP17KL33]